MKSKKLLLLTLAFGLFSMINSIALEYTLNNPYHNQGVKIALLVKREKSTGNAANFHYSAGSVGRTYQENHRHGKLGYDSSAVECTIQFTSEFENTISLPMKSYVAQKKDFITEKLFKETFSWDNKQGEISYKVRVHGRNSKIQSVKIAISKMTIDGVDLAHKDGL